MTQRPFPTPAASPLPAALRAPLPERADRPAAPPDTPEKPIPAADALAALISRRIARRVRQRRYTG